MKKEWTEQDLREFVRSAQAAFEDVTLTEADEEEKRGAGAAALSASL